MPGRVVEQEFIVLNEQHRNSYISLLCLVAYWDKRLYLRMYLKLSDLCVCMLHIPYVMQVQEQFRLEGGLVGGGGGGESPTHMFTSWGKE